MSLLSCKKLLPLDECTGNCKTYTLQGRIYDGTNNVGFSNTAFKLSWEYFRSNCIFCPKPRNDIYVGTTDVNGNFTILVNLDTTLFNDYSLKLITAEKENYYNSFSGYLDNSNLNQSNNIRVVFYSTTNLTLKLFRTQNDTFDNLRISHDWKQINGSGQTTFKEDYFGPIPNRNGDTTINIVTAADIVTMVTVSKYSNGTFKDLKDSLVCKKGVSNVITANY